MRGFGLFVAVLLAMLALVYGVVPFVAPRMAEKVIAAKAEALGLPICSKVDMGFSWRNGPGYRGSVAVSVPDTPWHMTANFGVSCGEWAATAELPATDFSTEDSLVALLLKRFPAQGVSNLVFSGSVSCQAQVVRTWKKPVPVWRVSSRIKNFDAAMVSGGQTIILNGVSFSPGASGLAEHCDIDPVFLRMKSASFGGFSVTNLQAAIRATEKSLMVNEATADFCGGTVSVYSLFLDASKLNAGFTLFMENIETGAVLSHIQGFQGEASGRLHGKVKASVREGGAAVRLSDMFLYSTPGEVGTLRMANPAAATESLVYAGLDEVTRGNIADALGDMDYQVLRFDLKRLDGSAARLTVQVRGTATRGAITVPVDLTLNLNGEIEQLINTGLGYSRRMKGDKK